MENYVLALFTHSGWKYAEVQALLGHVRREVRQNKMHIYTHAYVLLRSNVPSDGQLTA